MSPENFSSLLEYAIIDLSMAKLIISKKALTIKSFFKIDLKFFAIMDLFAGFLK